MSKRLIPLFDRVLIKKIVPQTKTASGILLPESSQTKLNEGVVISVGAGARQSDGKIVSPQVKEGDKVVLPEYGGSQLKLNGEEYTLLREVDLLGILKD